ncbi:MAG: methionine synthase [Lawsonibacter sp.]|nr:methionine synthase [Lawsonibacter sp.]
MPISVTQLNIDEALRYMGCPPEKADPATRELAEHCAAELLPVLRPRWAYRVFQISQERAGVRLDCGLLLPGDDLKAHLEGCTQAVLFCATLGAGTDALIRRTECLDMSRALALDCCASAAVEGVCDQIEGELSGKFPGCFFPFRYSPGYGDLPVSLQNQLLDLLDAPRRVGLTASSSHILLPRKSVTAVLGVSRRELPSRVRSCLSCPARENCQYRKSGGHCGIS